MLTIICYFGVFWSSLFQTMAVAAGSNSRKRNKTFVVISFVVGSHLFQTDENTKLIGNDVLLSSIYL